MSDEKRSVDPMHGVVYARPWALIVGLALIAFSFVLVQLRGRTPAPLPVDAPASEFSAGRAMALLGELIAEGQPHSVGTVMNARVRERIAAELTSLGYEVEIQQSFVCQDWHGTQATCAPVENVVTRLPGQVNGPAVMIMAHYDSVRAGPGAGDDTAGVAVILEIARALQVDGPRRNPVVLLLTEGEEVGLMGAHAFVDEHLGAQSLGVVINLEARGTGGQSVLFETSENNAWLVDAYASSVRRPAANSLTYEVYKALPNDSDLTVFKDAGVAGANFGFIEGVQHYHTPLDSLEYLDAGSVQHQGESVLALARALADADLADPPPGNATYTDLLNFAVIRWPATWTLPLAVAAVLILLACAVIAIRRGALTLRGFALGLLAAFVGVVLAILLGLGLTWLIALAGRGSEPWYAYPLPTRLALWAGALLCGALVAGLLGRRAGLWGLGLGAWLLWAILSVVLSVTLTGVAVVLLLPALLAALLAALALVVDARFAPAPGVAFALAPVGAGLLFLPLALGLEAAVGLATSPAITLPLGMVVATLLPLLALPPDRARLRRAVVAASAVVVLFAAVAALLVPPYSEDSPQQVNLYYAADGDTGQAHYASEPRNGLTPQPLRGHFGDEPMAIFPWIDSGYLAAPAEMIGAAGPAIELVSSLPRGENREVRLLLRSPRGADAMQLHVPIAHLAALTVAGRELSVQAANAALDDYTLRCYGLACDGLEVVLELVGSDAVPVLITDSTPGLPAGAEVLLRDRPATAAPYQEGDLTILWRRVEL